MEIIISTERVNICLAEEHDINTIIDFENHEDNKRFLWQGTYEEHLEEINNDTSLLLTFKEKKNNSIIGFALARLGQKSNIFELRRIAISKKNQGYGKESILGIIKYSFEQLNTNRFWLDVYPDNKIGINLYRSIGMYLEGTLRQSYKSERGYLDQMIFSLLREEYLDSLI